MRANDVLARVGGDQFALLVHDADVTAADVPMRMLFEPVVNDVKCCFFITSRTACSLIIIKLHLDFMFFTFKLSWSLMYFQSFFVMFIFFVTDNT